MREPGACRAAYAHLLIIGPCGGRAFVWFEIYILS